MKIIERILYEVKLLIPFRVMMTPLKLTRVVEKFDVVEKVPASYRIKM